MKLAQTFNPRALNWPPLSFSPFFLLRGNSPPMFAISKRSPPNENGTGRGGKTAAEGYGTQGARGDLGGTGEPSQGQREGPARTCLCPLCRTLPGCPGPAGGRAGTGSPLPPRSAGAWAPEGEKCWVVNATPAPGSPARSVTAPGEVGREREVLRCASARGRLQ